MSYKALLEQYIYAGAHKHPAAGGSAPGTWQVTWQYLACLLRNGELYEQLGAWEDALLAFKEGLLMVRTILWHMNAHSILCSLIPLDLA